VYAEGEDSLTNPGASVGRHNLLIQCHPFPCPIRRNLVDLNPMSHGTQNITKSVYHPVVDLRSLRLNLTRLQVISETVDLKKHYKDTAEEAQSNQVLATQAESKSRPPKVQEGNDRHMICTTIDVTEEPQRLPSQGARRGVPRL
jgi:hypothetical protein